MSLVVRTFIDPSSQQFDLVFRQPVIRIERRHPIIGIVRIDADPEFAFLALPINDGVTILGFSQGNLGRPGSMQLQARFDLFLVRPVTGKTIVREDRTDIAIETNLLSIPKMGKSEQKGSCEAERHQQPIYFAAPFTGLGLDGTPFSGTSTPEVHEIALRIRVRQLSSSQVA